MDIDYFKPPGDSVSRGSYCKYLKRRGLDSVSHIKGTHMKKQWTGKLVDHYKWWKAGKTPGDEPAIDWKQAGEKEARPRKRQCLSVSGGDQLRTIEGNHTWKYIMDSTLAKDLPELTPFETLQKENFPESRSYKDLGVKSRVRIRTTKLRTMMKKAAGGTKDLKKFLKFAFPEAFTEPHEEGKKDEEQSKEKEILMKIVTVVENSKWISKAIRENEFAKFRRDIVLQIQQGLGCQFIAKDTSIRPIRLRKIKPDPLLKKQSLSPVQRRRGQAESVFETTPPTKRGHPISIPPDQLKKYGWWDWCDQCSEPAPSVKKKGIRHFFMPVSTVINTFEHVVTIFSFSYLYKALRKKIYKYKPMKRFTGTCPHCKGHAILAKRMNILTGGVFCFRHYRPLSEGEEFPTREELIEAVKQNYTQLSDQEIKQKQAQFEVIFRDFQDLEVHLQQRDRFRKWYRGQREDGVWPLDLVAVTADAMAPLPIGKSQHSTSDTEHNLTQEAVFNVTITYRENGWLKPRNIYVDVLSRAHDKTGYAQDFFTSLALQHEDVAVIIQSRRRLEFFNDTVGGFHNQEHLFWLFKTLPQLFPNLEEISYLPFVSRHGKSDCDRHFQKVKQWTGHFEFSERVISHDDVKRAIERGSKAANQNRTRRKKYKITQIVIIQDLLPYPHKKKCILLCQGIKSTSGITWFKGKNGKNGKVVNHIFPDVDRSVGLELYQVVQCDYPKNHVNKPYKQSELKKEAEIKTNTLIGQEKTRGVWKKLMSKGQKKMKHQKLERCSFTKLKNARFLSTRF